MNITWEQVVVWLVVGALAGSFVGTIVKRSKEGFGRFTNLGVGLVGALIGGVLFALLPIDLGLGDIAVSLEDLVAAVVGAFILLIGLWLFRMFRGKPKPEK